MDIVSIEKNAFEELKERIDSLTFEAASIVSGSIDGVGRWLDNEDVCRMLNISKRTLHSYRANGTLPFARIEKKIYYDPADIERLLLSSAIISESDGI